MEDRPFPFEIHGRDICPDTIAYRESVRRTQVNVFPHTRFHHCKTRKVARLRKDWCAAARLKRLEESYYRDGMRTTVEGILLAHHNGHARILSLEIGGFHKLPGGRLKPGENEIEGLKRKLTSQLGCSVPENVPDWQIGECVATWWRPNFDHELVLDPNVPDPKECKKLLIVHMAEGMHIAESEDLKVVYLSFYLTNEHPDLFDPVISEIPIQLLQTCHLLHEY